MGATDTEVQKSILDAMRLVVTGEIADNINAPVVIKGEVLEVLDESNHQYKILYNNNTYDDVYAIADTQYSISTIVYVLIPEGDYSDKKWILGSVQPDADSFVTESKYDIYTSISSNLLDLIEGKYDKEHIIEDKKWNEEIHLKSWVNEEVPLTIEKGYQNFAKTFKDYLIKYRTFVFSALVKTDIDINYQKQGDYGLKMIIPTINTKLQKDNKQSFDIFMTTYQMEGDPYNYDLFQRINIYFSLNEEWTYDTDNLSGFSFNFFTKDFGYSPEDIAIIEDDIKNKRRDPYDIIIKDISLKIIDEIPEEKRNGRYLKLVSSDGNYFLSGGYATKKILTPILKINSKETNLKGWDCYWFVEDYSIETNSEEYLKIDGISNIGWKCLNQKTNEKQYITNNYSLEVKPSDVTVEARYRCVLTRTVTKSDNNQETVIVFDDISLKNLDSRISLSLSTVTGSNIFAENIGNVGLVARIETDEKIFDEDKNNSGYDIVWKRFDKNNNAIDEDIFYTVTKPLSYISKRIIDIGESKNVILYTYEIIISYPCKILDMSNTVYCTFYKNTTNNTKVSLGSKSILITTRKEVGYTLKIVNGDVLYKYDSDGDSPMISDYDGPISSRISSTKPFSYQVFKPDGYELSENEYNYVYCKWYIPKNSLIEPTGVSSASTWIDENGQSYYVLENVEQINYSIAKQYDKEKANNNNIKLEVKYDGNSIVQTAYPKFIKDGEGGTNGSKYTAIIKFKYDSNKDAMAYGEMDGNISRKLHMVWVNKVKGTTSKQKGWYYHNQDTGYLEDMPSDGLLLEVDFWENGIRNYKEVTRSWSIYDDKDTENTNKINCFNVESVEGDTKLCRFQKIGNWEQGKLPWTIVQCEITVTDEKVTKGISNQQIVRAYYPIEVTFLNEYDFNTKDNSNPRMLPTLRGGFDEVLYNMDGRNPEYDQEKIYVEDNASLNDQYNFVCENDIEGLQTYVEGFTQGYTYEWVCSSENLSIDKTSEGKDKDGNQIGRYAAISPKSRFQTGVGFNYIQVKYTWNKASKDTIKAAIKTLDDQIKNAEQKRIWHIGTYKQAQKDSDGKYKGHYAYQEYEDSKSGIKDGKYLYYEEGGKEYEINTYGYRQYIDELYNNWYDYREWIKILLEGEEPNSKEKRSTSFLTNIDNGITVLDNMIDLLNKIKNFCTLQGLNFTALYEPTFSERFQIVNSARIALYFLGNDSSIYNLEELKPMYIQDQSGNYIYYKLPFEETAIPIGSNQKSILDQLRMYSSLWDAKVKEYDKYYQELVKLENNNTITKYYETALKHLDDFKHNLDKIYDKIKEMRGNWEYNDEVYPPTKKEIEDIANRSNFYLDENQEYPEIDTTNYVDMLKEDINKLREVILPPDQTKIPDDRMCNIHNYEEFISQITDVIKYTYSQLGSYRRDEDIQDTFYKYLDEHRAIKKRYETILAEDSVNTQSTHIKPILMHTNTTGLGYINQWDGNRLYIDEDGGRYIMAPIMGAGKKEGGYFTGVVMGLREDNKKSNTLGYEPPRIGLHGFSHGDTSFFLNAEDGSAILGKNDNGQMIIDPSNNMGLIYNANYFSPDECLASGQGKPTKYDKIEDSEVGGYKRKGMLIKFTEERDEQGQIISSPFIHFAQADQGKIYSGDHKSIGIGNEGFYLSHDGLSIGQGFVVYAKPLEDSEGNHLIGEAHIKQLGSTLAGWTVKQHSIHITETKDDQKQSITGLVSKTKSGIVMDSTTSTIVLGSNSGRIYSGEHYYKDSEANGFYLGQEGISIGDQFYLSIEGTPHITFKKADAYISSEGRTDFNPGPGQQGFYLSNQGLSIGQDFQILASGEATIEQEKSKIGGWTIKVEKDKDGKRKAIGFNSSGSGIFMDSLSSTIMLGSSKGAIYSGKHNSVDSIKEGFYIDNTGLSIWNIFKTRQAVEPVTQISVEGIGEILVGNLKDSKKHWTIGGITPKDYKKIWIDEKSLAYGEKYTKDVNEGEELLKVNDNVFIPRYGDGATFITITSNVTKGTLYMSQEIYPILIMDYEIWVAAGRRIQDWDFNKWPIDPYLIPQIRPNCRVSDGEDGVKREKEKYYYEPNGSASTWDSYISYNTNQLGLIVNEDVCDILGVKYDDVEFDSEITKANQIYLGTNGLRIGKTFGIDGEKGSAIFKGNIEASHGLIGGWTISKKGLFKKIKDVSGEFNINLYPGMTKDKRWLDFQEGLIISGDGDFGYVYVYINDGEDSLVVTYADSGTGRKKTQDLVKDPILPNTVVNEWFGKNYWRGCDDGTLDVYSEGSHFGGVALTSQGTFYNTTDDYGANAFGAGMQNAVRETIFTGKWYTVYQNENTESPIVGYVKL